MEQLYLMDGCHLFWDSHFDFRPVSFVVPIGVKNKMHQYGEETTPEKHSAYAHSFIFNKQHKTLHVLSCLDCKL